MHRRVALALKEVKLPKKGLVGNGKIEIDKQGMQGVHKVRVGNKQEEGYRDNSTDIDIDREMYYTAGHVQGTDYSSSYIARRAAVDNSTVGR